ncbi:interactor of constitutive active ROPs 3-like isoform X2 [Hibiscus syriacus]|uniref:interactor of constitutive active ROPs 3-like isoform X2 n=1 Tax=Hibiscus syriacus TaxID=106335 RepID=UPI00192050FF|nr:interactor of constitutive active ROPs 3-like isoform X2 [Hibiscus syriacus]XP_039012771.1 interactor of constitutive active ROPs 3-like isoform X2 [Hibiscus syriacus]XP_039012772.1 interactor of constitutive active ROPs 3-like isoform X2 [Hibiscus syriacus]XP_039012773.1 interactor of constitutive active ROPs 3-like isoform X2 [Hibiscus syriacus]
MQTPKARNGSSELPQRGAHRAVRQLKPTTLETEAVLNSSSTSRTSKEKSPKVVERRSPRSPAAEKKRLSRISELEEQNSQLQEELKKAKDQLSSSETSRKQVEQDAEESKKQLLDLSEKLDESQKQLLKLSGSEETHVDELHKVSQEQDQAWQSELEAIQRQQSLDSAALVSAVNEIQRLKDQLEMSAESEAAQTKRAESAHSELQSLKGILVETHSLVENMKKQLKDSQESEAQTQAFANETLLQLEAAKKTVEALRSEGMKAVEAYSSIAFELEQSRKRVFSLEGLVHKLKAEMIRAGGSLSTEFDVNCIAAEHQAGENEKPAESRQLEAEIFSLKSEVARLTSALETAETKCHAEETQSTAKIKSAHELVEQIKSEASSKEAELLAELEKANNAIADLKANMMDKETELQCISEENDELRMKLDKNLSRQRKSEIENQLKLLNEAIVNLKANMMDKETELQISEENEMLRLEISKRDMDKGKTNDKVSTELDEARAAEREAIMKLGLAMEESDKNSRRVARVAEQLEAAQTANSEMEAELRRLKVQSDQWRKAAEAAAAMFSAGNNGRFMERTGSLDNNYNPVKGKVSSPYTEDSDDELIKKKNGNMLKKIGVLWKKPQK